eukprot:TRINITY_DN39819_c0_g1_i2.p1 TRINITY_DN39819_c0_g1~~TRINITY_DN39819_c0_g1_i2.p1  ORF type:complete len:276 (-),score=60.12 TRINITY_DN39819_c0_g1_i2:1-828(-)
MFVLTLPNALPIIVVQSILVIILGCGIGKFIHVHPGFGLKLLVRNQFVSLTLSTAVLTMVSIILSISRLAATPATQHSAARLQFFLHMFAIIGASVMHVALLLLRTKVIISYKPITRKLMNLSFIVFVVLAVALVLANLDILVSGDSPWALTVLFLSDVYGLIMVVVNILSTVCFYIRVRSMKASLGEFNFQRNARSTDLIASMGVKIPPTSLLGVVFIVCGQQVEPVSMLAAGWLYTGMSLSMTTVCLMWIIMKVKLDQLQENTTAINQLPIDS